MKTPLRINLLRLMLCGLLLFLAADAARAVDRNFTVRVPQRIGGAFQIARVKITLHMTAAPTNSEELDIFGVTNLTPDTLPQSAGPHQVTFRTSAASSTVTIDMTFKGFIPMGGAGFCGLTPSAYTTGANPFVDFPMTLTFGGGNIDSYEMSSYTAISDLNCGCARRRADNPGAAWATPPPGANAGRHPLDVVLVLDRSGSMGEPVPSGLTDAVGQTSTGLEPKIGLLNDAVVAFISLWRMEGTGRPGDRLGIVWFDSSFQIVAPGLVRRDAPAPTNWESLHTNQPAGGSTAMGDGFSNGVELEESNATQNDLNIVLLTDGMQNDGNQMRRNPVDTAVWQFFHLRPPPGPSAAYFAVADNCKPAFCIGVGAAGTYLTDLAEIAAQSGGDNRQVVTGTDMGDAFLDHLVLMLKGNTMSLLKRQNGALAAGSSSVSPPIILKLDPTVGQAIFVLNWSGQATPNGLKLELLPPGGGTPVVPAAQKDALSFTMQSVNLPATGPAGDWQARIVRNAGSAEVPFHLSVYTVESRFSSQFSFTKSPYGTGEDIILTAALSYNGQPLLNQGGHLDVQIERPQSALGTLLHNLQVSDNTLNNQPAGVSADSFNTPYGRKLYSVLSNSALTKTFLPRPVPNVERMFDDGSPAHGDAAPGDGIYSMRYADTKIPGTYKFKVAMNLVSPTSEKINRSEEHETQVNVLKIDPTEAEVNATYLGSDKYRLDIVPADRFGNFLGPGYADQIKVTVSGGGSVSGPIVDERQNGTYTAQLTGVASAATAIVKVAFQNNVFAETNLKNAQKAKRPYAIFAGLGGNFPHGDFGNSFGTGVSAHVGFEYMFTNRVSTELSTGYERFNSSFGSSHANMGRASGNIKFYPVIGTFQFGIFGGGGVYVFNSGNAHGGLNFGAVGEYRINTTVGVESMYNFHSVFTSGQNLNYSTLTGGLRFRF
jgi:hypothetical protein